MIFGMLVSLLRTLPSGSSLTLEPGGLIAAGVTYGTAQMQSTWAWRIPSALQGLFSLVCILILPFMPESPRWLAYRGRNDEALEVLGQTYSDGDVTTPIVLLQYKEITDTLAFEKETGETVGLMECIKTPSSRKRLLLTLSVAVFSMLSGNPLRLSNPIL